MCFARGALSLDCDVPRVVWTFPSVDSFVRRFSPGVTSLALPVIGHDLLWLNERLRQIVTLQLIIGQERRPSHVV